MAAFNLSPISGPVWQFFGGNTANSSPNVPLAGGLLKTYAAGTATPLATYANNTGSIPNGTTITLDPTGRIPGEIWFPLGVAYKFVLTDPAGNSIWSADNLVGINDTSAGGGSSIEWQASGFTPVFSSTTQFTTAGNSLNTFTVGRRIQATVTAGTVYGYVSSATGGGPTTVNVVMDGSEVLDSGLTVVNVGLLNEPNPSVPAIYPYGFTVTSLTASSGNIVATSGQFTGAGTGLTGTAAGLSVGGSAATAANLTGASPNLGTNWQIDSNGQLANNGNTNYVAAYLNSANITSGTSIPMDTSINQQGSNFSLSTGAIQTAAAGLYEASITFACQDPGVSNVATKVWFSVSAGTVYGPNSNANAFVFITPGASGGVDSYVTISCYWAATASATIIAQTNQTFNGASFLVSAGGQFKIRRVA